MSRNLSPVLRKQLENLDKDADNRKSALIAEETEADNERLEKDLEEIKLQIEELKKILVILIKTYGNGKTTISIYERKASIRQFYSVIFPALLQLQMGITDLDERGVWKKQRIKGIKLSDETSSQDFEDNYQSKTDLLKAVAIFVAAATGTVAINHSWVAANQDLAMALLFVIGYAGIIFEESLAFNKSGVGLLMAIILDWLELYGSMILC
ncbi:RING/U-box superfamily protein [Trifolium repens]|nr:RING/U-box superfamily protein [Trifolium repens]